MSEQRRTDNASHRRSTRLRCIASLNPARRECHGHDERGSGGHGRAGGSSEHGGTGGSMAETGTGTPGTGTALSTTESEMTGSMTGLETAGVGTGAGTVTRASDRERDAVVQRVQEAFAEGRLDDTEFDERMRAALVAQI